MGCRGLHTPSQAIWMSYWLSKFGHHGSAKVLENVYILTIQRSSVKRLCGPPGSSTERNCHTRAMRYDPATVPMAAPGEVDFPTPPEGGIQYRKKVLKCRNRAIIQPDARRSYAADSPVSKVNRLWFPVGLQQRGPLAKTIMAREGV